MRILITGANGFVGKHLIQELERKNYKIRCLVRRAVPELRSFGLVYGDISKEEDLKGACKGVDCVIHLAALKRGGSEEMYDVNVKGTENILNTVLDQRLKMFYISSFTALGPTSSEPVDETYENEKFCMEYERSKCEAKKVVKEYIPKGSKVTSFYPGIVYGPGDFNIFGRML